MAQSKFNYQQFPSEQFVESCGAVLFDLSDLQAPRVCLVNLLKTDEWMFAKGRRNVNESRKDAALREVTEETGYRCHLLPVRMATRACAADAPANVADKARLYDELTEPFMCTIRELALGKGVKIIWWYIATLDDDALGQRGAGEANFKPMFFTCEEAIEKLTFKSDREVLEKAIHILEATIRP
ncbi:NUDIX domain-containing protein [Pyrenochaeta sp. MPI-SDFR-AT-0127]|nr:NUDIX domain-containing protein [Pyrenochaeta sp. MPI-SDFR-AT-0127]